MPDNIIYGEWKMLQWKGLDVAISCTGYIQSFDGSYKRWTIPYKTKAGAGGYCNVCSIRLCTTSIHLYYPQPMDIGFGG